METALDRLSKIKTPEDLVGWAMEYDDYNIQANQIREVVALAKANQQPSIDAMRFEAATRLMAARIGDTNTIGTALSFSKEAIEFADALIAELQKPETNE